jgi:two-component system, LytTR family, response regulator
MNIVIIDDEKHCRELLKAQIERYCIDAKIVGEANGVNTGVTLIKETKPDLVFLDIQMNDGTGFDLLNKTDFDSFKLVFTTAFDEYAIKAFKYSAIHYLLKPIDKDELIDAYLRALHDSLSQAKSKENIINIYEKGEFETISLKTENSIYNINILDIEFIKAEGSYCVFNLENEEKIMISNPLKDYADILPQEIFIRTHKSYLVNLKQIKSFNKNALEIEMKTGKKTFVSRRNKLIFTEKLKTLGN